MLTIKHMNAGYGDGRVIRDLNMEVPDGKIVCLIGRNGVGKSTTLKAIMGLLKNTEGSVTLNGQELSGRAVYDRVKLGIGYVPQGRDIFPRMTVKENLELGMKVRGESKIPDYIFDLFPILPTFASRNGGDLSGGQQQQLAIARALVTKPKILILDEPTEGIQPSIIEDIGDAIVRVNKELGITVLIVEQYLDFVLGISHSLCVMEKGDIVLEGETGSVPLDDILKYMAQ